MEITYQEKEKNLVAVLNDRTLAEPLEALLVVTV